MAYGGRPVPREAAGSWLGSCFDEDGDELNDPRLVPVDETASPPVLVVEDDRAQREALCAMLDLEGFGHAEAANGREALDYLYESRAPCLVLLDLEMPVMNGRDFRSEQLADERLARIPVVVVTATDRALAGSFPGVEGFLRKPLEFGKLTAVLDRVCCRSLRMLTPEEA